MLGWSTSFFLGGGGGEEALEYTMINKQSAYMQGQRVLFLKTFVLTSGKAVNLWYTG